MESRERSYICASGSPGGQWRTRHSLPVCGPWYGTGGSTLRCGRSTCPSRAWKSLQKFLDLLAQDVIQCHLALIQHLAAEKSLQQGTFNWRHASVASRQPYSIFTRVKLISRPEVYSRAHVHQSTSAFSRGRISWRVSPRESLRVATNPALDHWCVGSALSSVPKCRLQ